MTLDALQAEPAGDSEKYLGALLVNNRSAKKTGQMLLEKMQAKLTGWKMHMLSHAGRLVLIQSVLMSLPVYYMTIEVIPRGIIKAMNSLMAKFFWGKTGQSRYMALVAWKKICTPIDKGGLGIRNLQRFGEALMMKLTWAMVSQQDKFWVKICKAKYCSQIGVWNAKEQPTSSPVWKQILRNRNFFREEVLWRLGDASSVHACSQPWFQGWTSQQKITRENAAPKVANLFDFDENRWKMEQLTEIFHEAQVQQIQAMVHKPIRNSLTSDCLIWGKSKSGRYSVKEGYQLMSQGQDGDNQTPQCALWKEVSNWKGIVPKIKLFFWRLLSGALMLATHIHRRMPRWSPMCQRCHLENEYETHCFFFCPGSRATWFISGLGLRTQDLSLDIVQAVRQCTQGMGEEEIMNFSTVMWEIWKGRNETVINHKKFNPIEISMKAKHAMQIQCEGREQMVNSRRIEEQDKYRYEANGWQVILDGSWETSGKSGCAYIIYHKGQIWGIGYSFHTLQNPLHAEVMALKEAVMKILEGAMDARHVIIEGYTDCQELAKCIMERDTSNISAWQAGEEVYQIIQGLQEYQAQLWLKKVNRMAVQQAHQLANYARKNAAHYEGRPRTSSVVEKEVRETMDARFFERVQEAPP